MFFQRVQQLTNSLGDSGSVVEPAGSSRSPLANSQRKSRFGKSEIDLHIHQEEQIDGEPSSQILTQEAILETNSLQTQNTQPREKV